jgi:hypothetical protein
MKALLTLLTAAYIAAGLCVDGIDIGQESLRAIHASLKNATGAAALLMGPI